MESGSEIPIERVPMSRLESVLGSGRRPVFGTEPSDHLLLADLTAEDWQDEIAEMVNVRVTGVEPWCLSPFTVGLHYAQAVFEGMLATKDSSGAIRVFRLKDHLYRLNRGLQRLAMPRLAESQFEHALHQWLDVEEQWIDREAGRALYIRPLVLASDPYIGVRPNQRQFQLVVMGTPHWQKEGAGLRLYVPRMREDGQGRAFARAHVGGTGDIKAAANYACTLVALREAHDRGYDDVLWMDAHSGGHVEEAGTSNVFFVFQNRVVTPPLTGTILPGITRATVIEGLREAGWVVEERNLTLEELLHAGDDLREAFTTGTASGIRWIAEIDAGDEGRVVMDGNEVAASVGRHLAMSRWGI